MSRNIARYTSEYFDEHKQRLFWFYPGPEHEWDEDKLTYKEAIARYPKEKWTWKKLKS